MSEKEIKEVEKIIGDILKYNVDKVEDVISLNNSETLNRGLLVTLRDNTKFEISITQVK